MSLTAVAAALMFGSALSQTAPDIGADAPVAQTAPADTGTADSGSADSGPSDPAARIAVSRGAVATPSAANPIAIQGLPEAPVYFGAAAEPVSAPSPAPGAIGDLGDASNQAADGAMGGSDDGGNEILVLRRKPAPPGDPLERLNEKSFVAVQAVDEAVIEPVTKAFNKTVPSPVRQGLRNFFNNLGEPVNFVAFLLELKPGKAMETAGRFAINTTLGVGGVMDIAKRKPFHLPYRANGLADVLGYYGVGPGPYMYLPLIGPTTLRDIIGDTVDNLASPTLLGKPFSKPEVVIGMTVVSQLGERAAFDSEINRIRESDNPYATYRELYLHQRKAEIEALHGRTLPDVVPVYGPGMPTAGSKADKARKAQAAEAGSAPDAGLQASPDVTPRP
ncbi:MlaA family lipoprotein [Novosphingobium sp. 1949]|uniref:MlaA family lipoprotein n=1 Tax=Novosphingobium organovorum TaxID=2930092 RepID=A0ABT0BHT0_9SPHN|nr:MlaA family lipoprotein [Novosphingobium organovorum]MCJ2184523.1 MlaA family lipoprotein [Novosphingobium organovorum]